jgi:hypothetical protein
MQIMLMHILQNVKPFPYLYILSILYIPSIVLNSTGIPTNEKRNEKKRGEEKCDYVREGGRACEELPSIPVRCGMTNQRRGNDRTGEAR